MQVEQYGQDYEIPKIQVVIRKRPQSKKEQAKNDTDIVEVRGQTVVVQEMKTKVDLTKFIEEHNFTFDATFDENSNNEQIYATCIKPIIQEAFKRAKVSCFAYGQTGSGKTYTMLGDLNSGVPGLYLLASHDIFSMLQQNQYSHLSCWLSFYEIYCGKLYDLLNDRQLLQAREDAKQNINIVGISEKRVTSVQQLMQIIEFGSSVRVTSQNSANNDSSRSHAILQIVLREGNNVYGKLAFIDLAGSERGADVTDQNKQTKIDGAEINKSLLALKECIRALDQGKNYRPFRGSKLTLVLKDSFIGNCKTVMIGNIGPCQSQSEHTLNTLRYADRVKELKNPSTQELNQQVSQLESLNKQLMLPRQEKNVIRYLVKESGPDYTGGQIDQERIPLQVNNRLSNNNNGNNQNQLMNLKQKKLSNQNFPPQNQQQQQQMGLNFQPMQQNLFDGEDLFPQPKNFSQNPSLFNPQVITNNQQNHFQQQANQQQNFIGQQQPLNLRQQQQYLSGQSGIPSQQNNISHQQQNQKQVNGQRRSIQQVGAPNQIQQQQQQNQVQHQGNQDQQNSIQQNIDSIKNWQAQTPDDLQVISQKHEQLIGQILAEEEDVIASHRGHIDDMVELVKQEMMLLHEVDKPGSDVDEYVESLDQILAHKVEIINQLRNRLSTFKVHLKEEEVLSKKFYEQRNMILDVFDLNSQNHNNDELQLLDDLPNFQN